MLFYFRSNFNAIQTLTLRFGDLWSARRLRQPLSRTSCSLADGLSTLNKELAIHLSQHPKVEVSLLVPEGACKDEDTEKLLVIE